MEKFHLIGQTLSHYRIIEKLGQGGMGEVYRARDTRLERDVAVKVLPSHLAEDPSALAHFEREAKAVAALSHPNILALFDVGREGPIAYAVMELLEGETLREHVASGPLPARKVIDYGVQVAEGLAAAHDRGFVHRDLKPDNLFLTAEGRVKILDFGLAKEVAPIVQVSEAPTTGIATSPGAVVGTAGYMAPEQVRGQAADQRADIFSLGVVLYELLTSLAPFGRETPVETMTAVLRDDPPELTVINAKVPGSLARLVQHCLEKNPSERFQSARDLAYSLKSLTSETTGMRVPGRAGPRAYTMMTGWRGLACLVGAMAFLTLGALIGRRWFAPPPVREHAAVLDIALPVGVEVAAYPSAALSRDGSQFVFGGSDRQGSALWLRSLASAASVRLPGTGGAELPQRPIWSPDGRYLLFSAERKIKRIAVASGTVDTLWAGPSELAASGESYFFAGDWNTEGDILFSWADLYRLRRNGGKPERIAVRRPEDLDTVAGQWLPDGRHYIFHVKNRASGLGSVFAGTLGSAERVFILASDSPATYVEPGYLLLIQSGGLFAQHFDAGRLKLEGQPVQLADGAEVSVWVGDSQWASKQTLAFARGWTGRRQLTWFDRSGREAGRVSDPLDILAFDLSRDGTRVVASVGPFRRSRLCLLDTTRMESPAKWLTDGPEDYDPRFNSEGDALIFIGQDQRRQGVFRLSVHDRTPVPVLTQNIEQVYETNVRIVLHDWSRDGRLVLYGKNSISEFIRVAPIADVSRTQVAMEHIGFTDQARFSPDGRWIACNISESRDTVAAQANFEVFVSRFPPRGEPQRITTHGGVQPLWRDDGRELYYLDLAGNLMAVDVRETSPVFVAGPPRLLFHTGLRQVSAEVNDYAVTGDGKRFLLKLLAEGEAQPGYTIIQNWQALIESAR